MNGSMSKMKKSLFKMLMVVPIMKSEGEKKSLFASILGKWSAWPVRVFKRNYFIEYLVCAFRDVFIKRQNKINILGFLNLNLNYSFFIIKIVQFLCNNYFLTWIKSILPLEVFFVKETFCNFFSPQSPEGPSEGTYYSF